MSSGEGKGHHIPTFLSVPMQFTQSALDDATVLKVLREITVVSLEHWESLVRLIIVNPCYNLYRVNYSPSIVYRQRLRIRQ